MDCAGETIIAGRYRPLERLGSGGMGSVWLCYDLALDSTCAVKVIDWEKSRSEEVKKRFIREAKAAAQLRGPHVVDVFDRGEFEGGLYLAMEYLEGEDLCTRLGREGKLDAESTYHVIAHVARALSSALTVGIVHRDLKPENIFLVPGYDEEIAKVLDFGIAQHDAYCVDEPPVREGAFLGTPYYVSPEQACGKHTDHRSDLWSLAVIAFQCLTGKSPFEGDSLGELVRRVCYEPIPRITEANPELSTLVEAFWTRATQRDRERRFQSARELSDALGLALGVKTVVTVPTAPPRRALGSAADIEAIRESFSTIAISTPRHHRELESGDVLRPTLAAPAGESVERAVTGPVQTLERPSTRVPRRVLVLAAAAIGVVVGALGAYGFLTRQPTDTVGSAPKGLRAVPKVVTRLP